MSNIRELASKWRFFILLIIVVLIPFYPKFLTPFFFALVILSFLEGSKKNIWSELFKNKPFLFLMLLYDLHLIGLLWTSNYKYAGLDLQIKLPLLLLPLSFLSGTLLVNSFKTNIFQLFNFSLILASMFCLIRAIYFYFADGVNYFMYKELSFFIHPGYFSMFLCFGVVLVIQDLFFADDTPSSKNKILFSWMLLIVFSLMIVLLASKSGVLILLLILGGTSILILYKRGLKYMKYGSALIFLSGLVIYLGFFSPLTSGRMAEMKAGVENNPGIKVHSTGMRIQAWQSAIELIKSHPLLGTGTGDVKDELVDLYFKNGFHEIYELKLNAHNQFLQTFSALGITGLLMLLLSLISAFIISVKTRDFILGSFLVIVILNMMIESILEVTAGAAFFSVFLSLFLYRNVDESITPD